MAEIQTGSQAVEFLLSRINYERVSAALSASDFKLDRMRRLLAALGDPQEATPAVHVAGTKGKGSTCAMMAGALTAAGYRTGLYTSPHVERFEERIQIDGELIDEAALVEHTRTLAAVTAQIDRESESLKPTFFELITALAWLWFRQKKVDLAVMEVGLGGRLDSTNICRPEVTVITTISRDHMHVLGSRLSEIASEKAGIIKPGVPLVSGVAGAEAAAVIEHVAMRKGAPLLVAGRDFSARQLSPRIGVEDPESGSSESESASMAWLLETGTPIEVTTSQGRMEVIPARPGDHQVHNATLAVAALHCLRTRGWNISDEAIRRGVSELRWPVRIEVVRQKPLTVIDAAHNWASARALLKTLGGLPIKGRRVLVFATSRDKDVAGLLRLLLPAFDSIVLTRYVKNPRACPVEELKTLAESVTSIPVHLADEPDSALKMAMRIVSDDGLLCVAGSFFLAAEAKALLSEGDFSGEVRAVELPLDAALSAEKVPGKQENGAQNPDALMAPQTETGVTIITEPDPIAAVAL